MSKGGKKAREGRGRPGPAQQRSSDPADPADPSGLSDRMLAELDDHLVLPAGAPVMMEFHQLNRRRRAQLTAALRKIQPRATRFDAQFRDDLAALAEGGPVDEAVAGPALEAGEEMFEFLADVEDLLALVAFDPVAFKRWADAEATTDEHLLALFSRFARSMREGEANSSST